MDTNISSLIRQMSKEDLSLLKSDIKDLIDSLKIKENESFKKIDIRPHCGGINFKKNGKTKDNQRCYCLDCRKTFSKTTGSFMFHSEVSEDKWLKFIDLEIAKLPLREESHFLNLSITTCYFMRHKLYQAISKLKLNEKLEKKTELDSAYMKINLKGTKPDKMPRISLEKRQYLSL